MLRIIWHLGNTTVRSPFRLREGLIALKESDLEGSLHGELQERKFRDVLGEAGIVSLGDDATFSVARKWRSALSQLGFIVPKLRVELQSNISEVGPFDTITKNGEALIDAKTLPGMQEVFLRCLLAYRIPNPKETTYEFEQFSPLKFVLKVLVKLRETHGEGKLSFLEMATIVQTSSDSDGVNRVVEQVINLRERRDNALNKRAFDNQEKEVVKQRIGCVLTTINDYADVNFRYLKASGLVVSKGRGISLYEDKLSLIEKILHEDDSEESPSDYFITLCNGASIPTDDLEEASEELSNILARAEDKGIEITFYVF